MTGRALQQAAIALTASVLLAALATPAHSASYTQYLCQKPNGAPAPAGGVVSGLAGAATPRGKGGPEISSSLSATLPASSQQQTFADLLYPAPQNTLIAGVTVR